MESKYVNCNLCGQDNTKYLFSKDGFKLVKCNNCGLIYVNPQALGVYGHKYSANRLGNELFEQRQKMYKVELKELAEFASGGKVLDFGCGEGYFLKSLGDKWEKYGYDINPDALAHAKQIGITNVYSDLEELKDIKFDLINIRGTLEHLPDPIGTLKQLKGMLKEGGLLYVSNLPNLDSIAGKIFKERFRLCIPPAHIYYYNEDTAKKSVEKAGFEVLQTTMPYIGTPYARWHDVFALLINKVLGKDSPPFYGSIVNVIAKKI